LFPIVCDLEFFFVCSRMFLWLARYSLDLISPVKLVRHTLEQERNRNFR
jgi:hypothetical protein